MSSTNQTFNKFERFIKLALVNQKHLDETKFVTKALNEEVDLSRALEKNLRLQLNNAQERIVILQRDLNQVCLLKEKIASQERKIEEQSKIICKFSEETTELKSKVEYSLTDTRQAIELMAQIDDLKKECQENKNKFCLLSCEHQSIVKATDTERKVWQESIRNLTNEIEQTKFEYNTVNNELNRLQLIHNKSIRDYEQTIQQYERDRKSIFGFDHTTNANHSLTLNYTKQEGNSIWDKKVNLTWADAARKAANPKEKCGNADVQDSAITSQTQQGHLDLSGETWDEDIALQPAAIPFKPKFKIAQQAAQIRFERIPTSLPKAKPLEIKAVREDMKSKPKKKKLYAENESFLD